MQILFMSHVILMAVSTIMVIVAVIAARGRKTGWLKKHKKFALTGACLAIVAGVLMVLFKNAMQYPHLASPHAIAGALSLALLIITPLVGLSLANGPAFLRTIHRFLGKITFVAVVLTAIAGILRFLQLSKNR